ncbi:TetR/AcrR family transcriptional regulator [Zobellia galactanivorans]|uniref:TetR/AcrR family transcriptional regulator n=1 Tax=Zobellia galactanivorans (strain DSM 12802 / CCUG 47099 / CIP 106680 / NCIMB 13871 / Dsij) TaxID=63186 RepID=UPI001C076834|nr:TetR/AcrR family transcriptional regulator [Zobellia galactanivorans]
MRVRDDTKINTIFEATTALTSEVGLSRLTMSSIAQRAKMASGTLYIYFDSKERLLNELYMHLFVGSTLSILPSIGHLPLKKQLSIIWAKVLWFRVTNSSEVIFMHQFRYSVYASEETHKLDDQFVGFIKNLLGQGKEELIIKNIDSDLIIPLFYGYANNLARQMAMDEVEITDAIIDQTFHLCWDAIKS